MLHLQSSQKPGERSAPAEVCTAASMLVLFAVFMHRGSSGGFRLQEGQLCPLDHCIVRHLAGQWVTDSIPIENHLNSQVLEHETKTHVLLPPGRAS